jgi:hypothetical protein
MLATSGVLSSRIPKIARARVRNWGIDGSRVRLVASHDIPQAAPTFSELAAEPSITEYSLRALLRSPHETMPQITFKPDQMDDIAEYILSLRGGQGVLRMWSGAKTDRAQLRRFAGPNRPDERPI